jgi:protein-S-isoprenylcysteine O-methyltransferase Ste14
MVLALFYLALAAGYVLGAALLRSVVSPAHCVWPPPSSRSWQFWLVWALIVLVLLSLVVLAVTGWDRFVFPDWLRYLLGLPLLVGGLILAFLSIRNLGAYNSAGLEGELVTGGLYRYSRNPQYLGDIISLVGLVLFSNAALVVLPGLLTALLFALWPFCEEPCLRQRFGEDYTRYC